MNVSIGITLRFIKNFFKNVISSRDCHTFVTLEMLLYIDTRLYMNRYVIEKEFA